MSACTPAKNSTGLMSWLKLNKEGPPEHQGVSIDHNLFLWKYAWKGLIARWGNFQVTSLHHQHQSPWKRWLLFLEPEPERAPILKCFVRHSRIERERKLCRWTCQKSLQWTSTGRCWHWSARDRRQKNNFSQSKKNHRAPSSHTPLYPVHCSASLTCW